MRASALTGVAAAATALAVVLSGCGSDSKTATSSSSSSSEKSSTSKSSAASTTKKPTLTTTAEAPTGPNPTIADYLTENDITQTVIQPGDTSAPPINIPIPDGWENVDAADLPKEIYGGAIYSGADFAEDPPQIQALYVRLTGNVDPQKVLELAPGELMNFPGFSGGAGEDSTLGEFPAHQLGGSYDGDGGKRFIAQKTAVIPAQDGTTFYVLQLNVEGPDAAQDVIGAATDAIDTGTTIG